MGEVIPKLEGPGLARQPSSRKLEAPPGEVEAKGYMKIEGIAGESKD